MVYSQPYVQHWEMNNYVMRVSFMHPDRKVISHCQRELTQLEFEQLQLGRKGYLEWNIRALYETFAEHIQERFPELFDIVFPPNSLYRKWLAEMEIIRERGWVGG